LIIMCCSTLTCSFTSLLFLTTDKTAQLQTPGGRLTLEWCFHLPHITTFNRPCCIFELRTNYNSYLPAPHSCQYFPSWQKKADISPCCLCMSSIWTSESSADRPSWDSEWTLCHWRSPNSHIFHFLHSVITWRTCNLVRLKQHKHQLL
jgi:hypothetical protein